MKGGTPEKMKKYANFLIFCFAIVGSSFFLNGCSIEETNRTKVRDLEYAIVEEEDIPEELKVRIEEKKAADFKITYKNDEYLYIARGFGQQETGGYGIGVKNLYLTPNTVIFYAELVGPRKGETVNKSPSFPYIVIRTEVLEENVVFE